MHRIILIPILFIVADSPVNADTALPDGLYDIQVVLELPSVLNTNTQKTVRLCLGSGQTDTFGLTVLSNNNPLRKCAHSNAVVSAAELSFDIACPGENAARAKATYQMTSNGFRGRIEMTMGGKNMTMTEVQTGRRIGNCDKHNTR